MLRGTRGVRLAQVAFLSELARVVFDVRATSEREIVATLARAGYSATPIAAPHRADEAELAGSRLALCLVLLLNQLGIAFAPTSDTLARVLGVRLALGAVVLCVAAPAIGRRALAAARRGRIGRDAVILFAALVAMLLAAVEIIAITGVPAGLAAHLPAANRWPPTMGAELASALVVFTLVAYTAELALRREALQRLRTRSAQRSVVAFRIGDGAFEPVRRSALAVGDVVRIVEGDIAPTDIRILEPARFRELGERGEPVPREHAVGDVVAADTVLLSPEATGVVVRPYDSELTAAIDAETSRAVASLESDAARDSWASTATRALMIAAGSVTSLALVLQALKISAKSPTLWLAALAVIAAATPAAFTTAVTIANRLAILRAHAQGIVVKDPNALRRLAQVDVACFDKTGTITTGELSVVRFRALREPADPALLEDVLAIERASSHRVGHAIATYLRGQGVRAGSADAIWEESGGIAGRVRGRLVEIAAPRRVRSNAADAPPHVVMAWVIVNGEPEAVFELTDPVRPGADGVARALWHRGIAVRLLSGDRAESASFLGHRLGVATTGDLSPAKKALVVRDLQHAGARVLYVTDGLTGATGSAQADVSIAIAPSSLPGVVPAPIVVTANSLVPLASLVDLARSLDTRVRENFAIGIVYAAVVLPLCALGYVSPLYAAALTMIETLVVFANASRLLREPRRHATPTPRTHAHLNRRRGVSEANPEVQVQDEPEPARAHP